MTAQYADPAFTAVVSALYGDAVDPREVAALCKGGGGQAQRERRQARVGLASNALGITAGVAGLKEVAGREAFHTGGRSGRAVYRASEAASKVPGLSRVGRMVATHPRVAAGGALGLQAANLAGDAVANRVLARASRDRSVRKGRPVAKAMDLTFTGTISKVDPDKRQVFGWCSLSQVDGRPVVDLQGDYVPLEEIEKSAYTYVLTSRKGGDMHRRVSKLDAGPVHTADLIESFVVTPEKLEKMGLPQDALPHGWWVGYKVNDDDQWAAVKAGRRLGFSIHGTGVRKELA